MSREIKFNFIYGIDGNEATYFNKTFTFGAIENGDHMEELCDMPLYREYSILGKRQFTGLKDKNGVEIYEGDLLAVESQYVVSGNDPNPFRRVIAIDPHNYQLNAMQMDGESASGATFCKRNCEEIFEVIGNIYENSDLLENKEES